MNFRVCWAELKNARMSICLFLAFAILLRWLGWVASNGPDWARMSGPSILLPYFSNIYLTALVSGTLCLPIILVFRIQEDRRRQTLDALPVSRLSAAFQRYSAILVIQVFLFAAIFVTSSALSVLSAVPGNGGFPIVNDQLGFVIRAELGSLGLVAIHHFMKGNFPSCILATSWICSSAMLFIALGPFTCKYLSLVPAGSYACKLYSGDSSQIAFIAAFTSLLVIIEILIFLRPGPQAR